MQIASVMSVPEHQEVSKKVRNPVKISFESIKQFLETISIISALLLSCTLGPLFGISYDDIDAANNRFWEENNSISDASSFRVKWACLGAWCAVLFLLCILFSTFVYIDLGLFVGNGATDADEKKMQFWYNANKLILLASALFCLIGVELLCVFFYYCGYLVLPVSVVGSISWTATGATVMVTEMILLLFFMRNWFIVYSGYGNDHN